MTNLTKGISLNDESTDSFITAIPFFSLFDRGVSMFIVIGRHNSTNEITANCDGCDASVDTLQLNTPSSLDNKYKLLNLLFVSDIRDNGRLSIFVDSDQVSKDISWNTSSGELAINIFGGESVFFRNNDLSQSTPSGKFASLASANGVFGSILALVRKFEAENLVSVLIDLYNMESDEEICFELKERMTCVLASTLVINEQEAHLAYTTARNIIDTMLGEDTTVNN